MDGLATDWIDLTADISHVTDIPWRSHSDAGKAWSVVPSGMIHTILDAVMFLSPSTSFHPPFIIETPRNRHAHLFPPLCFHFPSYPLGVNKTTPHSNPNAPPPAKLNTPSRLLCANTLPTARMPKPQSRVNRTLRSKHKRKGSLRSKSSHPHHLPEIGRWVSRNLSIYEGPLRRSSLLSTSHPTALHQGQNDIAALP